MYEINIRNLDTEALVYLLFQD